MNGNKHLVFLTMSLVLFGAFAGLALADQENEAGFGLKVDCVDKTIGKEILLTVIPEGANKLTLSAQCGPNILAVGRSGGFILPFNETALVVGGAPFLIGSTHYLPGQAQGVLQLMTAKVRQLPVVLQDQSGNVVGNVRCKIVIRIPMGEGASATNWERSMALDVDSKGTVTMPVVEGMGKYSIRCEGINTQGVKYKGESEWTGKALTEKTGPNGKIQPLEVSIVLEKPSVKVNVEWNPDLKFGTFSPDYGNVTAQVLGIEGLTGSEMLINKTGEVWFYGLKPGAHRIALSQSGKTGCAADWM